MPAADVEAVRVDKGIAGAVFETGGVVGRLGSTSKSPEDETAKQRAHRVGPDDAVRRNTDSPLDRLPVDHGFPPRSTGGRLSA